MISDNKVLFTLTRYPGAANASRVAEAFKDEAISRTLDIRHLADIALKIKTEWFPFGCVIDLQRLGRLVNKDLSNLQEASTLARIKLQGTDGIRGKTSREVVSKRRALELYLQQGILTPGFFGLNAEAFGRYLIASGGLKSGDSVVVGEDGRDRLMDAVVVPAVIRGLNAAGCHVLDAGIIPTPGVPIAARHWNCRGGVIITASHNPSNQNGIKLLYDSFKLMDDGLQGEFGLSRSIYALAEENNEWSGDAKSTDISIEANKLLEQIILENINFSREIIGPVTLAYDGANGAFSELAPAILKTLPLEVKILNVDARGSNINQDGGVGEIEGTHSFSGKVNNDKFESYFPVVRQVFTQGRANPEGLHVAIVNDGDGDRGYLLVYEQAEDSVLVVPGDELAMLILGKRFAEGTLEKGAFMVNSVESDIMAASFARRKYGVNNETACVGDKWLLKPAREGRPFVVGCEESGHVTFGVQVPDQEGEPGIVFTGNGLLATLTALEFAIYNNLSSRELAEPFPSGHKDIRYVYFVDKERFLPGSELFLTAGALAVELLSEKLRSFELNVRLIPFADAPEMLYVGAFESSGIQVGSLFARNSGTESKTGVAIRCRMDLQNVFQSVMDEIHNFIAPVLKDESSLEGQMEKTVRESLARTPLNNDEIQTLLKDDGFSTLSETDFDALMYAMRKQKMITTIAGKVQAR